MSYENDPAVRGKKPAEALREEAEQLREEVERLCVQLADFLAAAEEYEH